jgi:uncharacterized membrane protein HdeD (DUF308 family)
MKKDKGTQQKTNSEKMDQIMAKTASWLAVAVYAVIGICMLLFKDDAARIVIYGLAIALVALGIVWIIRYLRKPPKPEDETYAFAFGLAITAFGAIIAVYPDKLESFFLFLCGSVLILGSLLKLQMALDAFRWKIEKWWVYIIGAAVSLILGLVGILAPSVTTVFIGIAMIVEALMDVTAQIVKRRLNVEQKKKNAAAQEAAPVKAEGEAAAQEAAPEAK